jgi:VIT1/CCC1 family predicted Fe2+/Mn2+ transporter
MSASSDVLRSGVAKSLVRRVRQSFHASIGDVVFGMEDGTVSIFGLVFGVAVSTDQSSVVLLAGSTGAIAAAVSMMAGAYLDAESERDRARVEAQKQAEAWEQETGTTVQGLSQHLAAAGIPATQVKAVHDLLASNPQVLRALRTAFMPAAQDSVATSPLAHALWMFIADLFAAFVPVIPFALLVISDARLVSVLVTALLLVALGIGRGLIGQRSLMRTTLETLTVAAAAAAAGIIIGKIIA